MPHNPPYRQAQSSNSSRSAHSDRSYDTAPTDYNYDYDYDCDFDYNRHLSQDHNQDFFHDYEGPVKSLQPARASVATYASTDDDLADDDNDIPDYHVPHYNHEPLPTDAIPTTPRDFAELFPTTKRISIRHDDATIDGNMNLRVDTQVEERYHRKQNYTLYHLRMQDLRTRDFSLRRYCRESGREVCHSIRKYQKPPQEKRPVLQRASTALSSLVHKGESRPSTAAGLKRSDSGYESVRVAANQDDEEEDSRPKSAGYFKGRALMPTNTIKLEFSNYAHLDVKRRGAKSNKKYTFEHWGNDYSWKRIVKRKDDQESVSYYLVRDDDEKEPLAHICPVDLTQEEAQEEAARGGWVPPCYMRITDDKILKSDSDIADVVVATGLMTLVDDSIKRRFHSKQSTQMHIPLMRSATMKMNMEYIGPKRLIDEMFNRGNRGGNTGKPSALRRTSAGA